MAAASSAGPFFAEQKKNVSGCCAACPARLPAVQSLPCMLKTAACSIVRPNAAPSSCKEPTPGTISSSSSGKRFWMVRQRLYSSGSPETTIPMHSRSSRSGSCSSSWEIFPIGCTFCPGNRAANREEARIQSVSSSFFRAAGSR